MVWAFQAFIMIGTVGMRMGCVRCRLFRVL